VGSRCRKSLSSEQGQAVNWDDTIIDAAATDTGMRRANNQDSHTAVRASHAAAWRSRGHVFMVADGMGAHAVGELASKMACDLIPHTYLKARAGTPSEAITKAFREVSSLIYSRASANRDFQGMGTTCSALVLLPEGALISHVGDSRVYRFRRDRIDQFSFDHSLVWELVRRNHLTSEQASLSVPKNVITRSLGPEVDIEVDIEGPLAVEMGDVFLLCSDGLSGPVDDHEIGAFAGNFHPRDACRYLISLANLRGGLDNITVQIVRIGQWIDPDSAEVQNQQTPEPGNDRQGHRQSFASRLAGFFKPGRRAATVPGDEEHPYRTAECPIDDALIDRLEELTRNSQEQAIAQAWSVDWTTLATLRREAADARSAGNRRVALRKIGEIMTLLGEAARFYRKVAGTTPFYH
jgi:PPM family protein phosphatase